MKCVALPTIGAGVDITFGSERILLPHTGRRFSGGAAERPKIPKPMVDYSPASPATHVEVALLMSGVALVTCLLPAWRAIRVNPMVALRYE